MEVTALNTNAPTDDLARLVKEMADLRTFVARRFDEISMEINATSQIVGMSEDTMVNRFSEVLGVLNGISYSGNASTPHNVGVELDAVVKTTEEAANTIIDCATVISALTQADINWQNADERDNLLGRIQDQVMAIIGACAFQDLAGQRIGRTLDNIRQAEDKLADTLKKLGMPIDTVPQHAIDDVKKTEASTASQADIDALFD